MADSEVHKVIPLQSLCAIYYYSLVTFVHVAYVSLQNGRKYLALVRMRLENIIMSKLCFDVLA